VSGISSSYAVLHVALNPYSGVWAVMRSLANAQLDSGKYSGVGIAVVIDSRWPARSFEQLTHFNGYKYTHLTPRIFGTASLLYQIVSQAPLAKWVEEIYERTGAQQICIQFHNAWMSGVFLPIKTRVPCKLHVVSTFHGVNIRLREQPVIGRIHRLLAKRLNKESVQLTSVDAANIQLANELFGIEKERFEVIHNGVSETKFMGCPYLSDKRYLTVGHVGTLSEEKGWRITADAVLSLVHEHGLPIRMIIAGKGSDEDDVRALVKNSKGVIKFQGHVASPREMVFPQLDLLSVLSRHEGLPMSIIEALAAGVPTLATDVGGIPEIIIPHKNGMLVRRDKIHLAKVIKSFIDNPAILAKMSQEARRSYKEKFDINKIIDQYHRVYTRRIKV